MENNEFIEVDGVLPYEEFLAEAWDYVSPLVVSDKYWEENKEFINECTFNMYKFYCSKIKVNGLEMTEVITIKDCGRILEFMIADMLKFNPK